MMAITSDRLITMRKIEQVDFLFEMRSQGNYDLFWYDPACNYCRKYKVPDCNLWFWRNATFLGIGVC